MDKNTIIGFVLMFTLLMGYNWYTAPTQEELAQMELAEAEADAEAAIKAQALQVDNIQENRLTEELMYENSLRNIELDSLGGFAISDELLKKYGPLSLAVFGQDMAHVNWYVTKVYIYRAWVQAFMAGGAVVSDIIHRIEMRKWDAAPGLLFI